MEIKRQFDHGKLGNFLFDICALTSTSLYKKCKFLYWFIQFTWGLPMILLGLIISLVLLCCGQKPIKTPIGWRFEIGKSWGGFDCGIVYIRDRKAYTELSSLDYHEMGHCLTQNLLLGPLFPILVALPSVIWYWVHELKERRGKAVSPYDSLWFEDLSTVGGTYFIKNLIAKNK